MMKHPTNSDDCQSWLTVPFLKGLNIIFHKNPFPLDAKEVEMGSTSYSKYFYLEKFTKKKKR